MATRTIVPVGRLQVATPNSMALAVRSPTQARDAVDERIQDVASTIIAGSPTVVAAARDAAEAAVAAELSSEGVVLGLPTEPLPVSSRDDLELSWANKTLIAPYYAANAAYPTAVSYPGYSLCCNR